MRNVLKRMKNPFPDFKKSFSIYIVGKDPRLAYMKIKFVYDYWGMW